MVLGWREIPNAGWVYQGFGPSHPGMEKHSTALQKQSVVPRIGDPQNYNMICTPLICNQEKWKLNMSTKILHQWSQATLFTVAGGSSKVHWWSVGERCLYDAVLLIYNRSEGLLLKQTDFDAVMLNEGRQRKTTPCRLGPLMKIV